MAAFKRDSVCRLPHSSLCSSLLDSLFLSLSILLSASQIDERIPAGHHVLTIVPTRAERIVLATVLLAES
jgi:hypothetical protein